MSALLHDVRRALGALQSRPSYVIVTTVTLGLGIGATTAIFSVVDALMLRPLPFHDPARIVELAGRRQNARTNIAFSYEAWRTLQQLAGVVEGVEAYSISNRVLTGGPEPLNVSLLQVSPGLMQMLGVPPQIGRTLGADDAGGATGPVVVLSHRLWRQLGGDATLVGRTIDFADVPHTVVGVMPPEFVFPRPAIRAWVPLPQPAPATVSRPQYELIARLQEGVTIEQANRVVAATGPRLHEIKGIPPGRDAVLERPSNITLAQRRPVLMLFAAVLLVLIIACANVANLSLANASVRRRELAVCLALGASRARLGRQLLLENLVVSTLAGIAGVWLAFAAVRALVPLIPTELSFFTANQIQIDRRVLLFATLASLVTAIVAGLVPAIRASRADVSEELKNGGRTATASKLERRGLSAVAMVQCALAVLLLVAASVLVRSFLRLVAVDPGFDAKTLAVLNFQPPRARYPDAAAQNALGLRLMQEFRAVPGVVGTTRTVGMPPKGGAFYFEVDLETNATPGVAARDLEIAYAPIDRDYFSVMGIRMLAGRQITDADGRDTVVIGEPFAHRFWGSAAAAVGGRFRLDTDEPWQTIAGVAADVKQMGLDDRLGDLEFYQPWSRTGSGWGTLTIAIRTIGEPSAVIPALKQRVWSVDPKLPILESREVRDVIAESVARPRFFLILMAIFGLVAACVAAIGIYGLFSYLVSQRTHEIGIRLAMGATPGQVGRLVIRHGIALAAIGTAIGLGGAAAASKLMTTLLFQTTPTDPAALAGGAACLLVLALVACYLPARRAQKVDPLIMLKVE